MLLPTACLLPAVANDEVIPPRESLDEVVRVSRLRRADDLLASGAGATELDVRGDAGVEEDWLLTHHADEAAGEVRAMLLDVRVIRECML